MKLIPLILALSILPVSAEVSLQEDFSSPEKGKWHFDAPDSANGGIRDGRLVLDLGRPESGKWAYADLSRGIYLPAKLEWDQRLEHDSPHTYFGGLWLWSGRRGPEIGIHAGLGGSGLKRSVFLINRRSDPGMVTPGVWYHLVLELRKDSQTLRVLSHGSEQTVAFLTEWRALFDSPYYVRFFQNDRRLGPRFPDTYRQDRGITWIDNLRIHAAKSRRGKPPERMSSYPFRIPIVFNRAMRWITRREGLSGGAIAYDAAGWLPLTGNTGASRWLELRPGKPVPAGQWPSSPSISGLNAEKTVFHLPDGRKSATYALRAFQFNLEQHRLLHWRAVPTDAKVRLEITITDGKHPFLWKLWQSKWLSETAGEEVDLLTLYRNSGRTNRYGELDFLLHVERTGTEPKVALRLGLEGQAAIVPRWPVINQALEANEFGSLLEAVLIGENGRLMTGDAVRLEARVHGRSYPLTLRNPTAVRRALIRGLETGDHQVRLIATGPGGKVVASTSLEVSITDLPFTDHYEVSKRSYCTDRGEALGPLLGDLLAWIPFVDLGTPRQRLIRGLDEKRDLIDRENRKFGFTRWRSLARGDLDSYVNYMAESGVRALRLAPNVNPAEYYCDAGGHLAPHGLEQIAYILAAARRRRMRAVINLFHYPYLTASTGNNPPVWQYLKAGYPGKMKWTSPEMWQRLSSYLRELLGYLKDDPAVMAFTLMGENDQRLPREWIEQAWRFVKSESPRQMLLLEQGGNVFNVPGNDLSGYDAFSASGDGGVGYRGYGTFRYPNDCFLAVSARLFGLHPPAYLGEVSCGINTQPQFIVKHRDALGLALTLQQPLALAWSAVFLEGQCKAFTEVAQKVDWTSFRRATPPVAIVVGKIDRELLARLVRYEEFLSSVPVDSEYVRPGANLEKFARVFDARVPVADSLEKENLPDGIVKRLPLNVSTGSHTSYAVSDDGAWLVAYLRNATHYEKGLCDIRSIEQYRLADRKRDVRMELRSFPGISQYSLIDPASAKLLRQGLFSGHAELRLSSIDSDLLLLVRPKD